MTKTVLLGDVISQASLLRYDGSDYPVLSMTMHDGIVMQKDRFKKDISSTDKSNYKIVKKGQLVVGFPIDEGVIYIQDIAEKGIMSPAYNIWDVKQNLIDTKFLELCLHSPQSMAYYKSKLRGTTARRRSIPTEDLLNLRINLPDIKEQKKRTAYLRIVDSIIRKRRNQLELADTIVKSRFIEMFGDPDVNEFGWNEEKLGDCLSVIGGYAFKSSDFKESGVPILRIGNINTGSFRPTNLVYWKNDIALDRYKIYPGDLVMSLTGTVGKDDYGNVCILGDDYPTYYLNQRNAKLVLGDKLNKIYLAELLKWPKIKNRLTGISRGIRQANISNKDIVELNVPIPSIEIQNQFADFVAQVNKSKLAVQQSLNELETLKKSLMQQYFG